MSDQDPINDLTRFGAGFSTGTGGDMSRSAADIRRRGDQIRRRRTALVAGASALAVAAVAVPIFAVVGGTPKADNDNIAGDPPPAVTADDLLRDADTEYFPGETAAFRTVDTYEGDEQATFHPCQQATLSSLGAASSLTRTYEYVVSPDAGEVVDVPGDGLVETIAQFDDADAARAAYDRFAEWILDCEGQIPGAERVKVIPQARSVEIPTGGDAVIYDLNWGPVPVEADPFGDSAYINETGLVLQGDRIAVVAVTIVGQDYNFVEEDGGTPVDRMIRTAAARLQPGAAVPSPPAETDGATAGEGGVSLLGDGLELVQEMVTNDSGDPVRTDPTAEGVGDLDFCGTVVDPGAGAAERLAANSSGPEYGEARELVVLPSAAEADALAASIVDAARNCPTSGADGSAQLNSVATREDQPLRTDVVTQTYETDGLPQLGTTTWVVAHDGPLVLVAMTYGEGSSESEALVQTTEEFLGRLRGTMEWVLGLSGS